MVVCLNVTMQKAYIMPLSTPETTPKAREPILQVRNLKKYFGGGGGFGLGAKKTVIQAVEDVSFDLYPGETLGMVGESGCGNSTVARTLLRLDEPTSGEALFHGKDIFTMNPQELIQLRRKMQVIFQDPYASLNPRMSVEATISEPWSIHKDILPKEEWPDRVRDLLESVGLRRDHAERYPHQFSGGQLQRIGIARAMTLEPEILLCDEPVSALDLSIQAQVINLLEELQERFNIAFLFIAHDLSVVRHISDRVAVMYLGRVAELGTEAQVYETPRHPYTRALLSAEPNLEFGKTTSADRIMLQGEVPSPANPPSGCRFRTRCWKAQDICAGEAPDLAVQSDGNLHQAACYFPEPLPE
jgi:oligopeptide transport system ATP-binding protein